MLYRQKTSRYWWMDFRDGRRRVRKSTRTTNLEEAKNIERIAMASVRRTLPQDFIHAMVDMLYGKRSSETRGTPCSRLFEDYKEAVKAVGKRAPQKLLDSRRNALSFVVRFFKDTTAESLTPADIRAFASWYASSSKHCAKTRHNNIAHVITVLRALGLPSDGWRAILPQPELNRLDHFNEDEERRILEAAKGTPWYPLSLIARHTGLRRGDCAGLTWANMDTANKCIRVQPSKTARHGIEVVLPLPPDVWADVVANVAAGTGSDPLFPKWSQFDRPTFGEVMAAAGVTGHKTFHSWRHTFRTRLSEAGVPDEIAMRLGGWTQRSTAMRYDHAERIEELRAAVEKAAT